eukprot:7672982-Ditylum_brightwellii.AAC.1
MQGYIKYGDTQITWDSRCADITLESCWNGTTLQGIDQLSMILLPLMPGAPMMTQVPRLLA